jgi:hypothetical protein
VSAFRVEGSSSFGLLGRTHAASAVEPAPPSPRRRRRWPLFHPFHLGGHGTWQVATPSWIHAKALLAQKLIA